MGQILSFTILMFLGVGSSAAATGVELESFYIPDQNLLDLASEKIDEVDLWEDTSVSVLRPSTSFKRKIPLKVVVIRRSTWSKEQTISEIRTVEEIFSQCKFSFSPITIVQTSITSNPMYDVYGSDVELMNDGVFTGRPLVFIDEKRPVSMDTYNPGYSNPVYWTKDKISANSAFVFNKGYESNKRKFIELGYTLEQQFSVLAHELAHVLFNDKHNKEKGNILCGDKACTGSLIEKEQCESIAESFFL